MKRLSFIALLAFCVCFFNQLHASKLVKVSVVDKDYLMLYFLDGEVSYTDNGVGSRAYTSSTAASDNTLITYGAALNTTQAGTTINWNITSSDDNQYGTSGKNPIEVHRKSKLSGLAQMNWNSTTNDFNYEWAYEHTVFLKLPHSLQQGKTYTLAIQSSINSDKSQETFVFNIFNSRSEAIKVNIAGYSTAESIKAADLYMWLGDGGARDYSSFVDNDVYLYNVHSESYTKVGAVSFWKAKSSESSHSHNMIQSPVWNVDFTGHNAPGTYRLAIEGIGCSDEFIIAADAYLKPLQISTLGFFYMRIGQDSVGGIYPVPRRPLWIPNQSPENCKVYITTMHPYHQDWENFCGGDKWDCQNEWATYSTGRLNPNAYGGHSDALDWDRHLGHVPIIYDILLPYYLSGGSINEDNFGIAESGNGIPDVLDEARNEVDFWLRLRDGKGYSHGLNNPNENNILYQAANTTIAAWANAANAAMLASCFKLAGLNDLAQEYKDSAINAYSYAAAQPDQMLDKMVDYMSGKDFKITAAAFLYNLTGEALYENAVNDLSSCTNSTSVVQSMNQNQLYAVAAYLHTHQPIHYPTLYNNMKSSVINEAKQKEANYSLQRPSRRSSDNDRMWFVTEMVLQRSIVAHSVATGADKQLLENALILEADWTLGRNPLNMIQMTTATTDLAHKHSVQNAYTSGWNDGAPGVHPGHTPYMNIYDWGGTMVMGNPSWMTSKNYPADTDWPHGEMYYNVRYVYAANEFTPQQTMRGKQALYGYLHAISPAVQSGCATPTLLAPHSICGLDSAIIQSGLSAEGKSFTWYRNDVKLHGITTPTITITEGGTYKVEVDSGACIKSAEKIVGSSLPLDLGETKTLCSTTEFILDAQNSSVPTVSYIWNTGDTTQTITAYKAGTYSVTVSARNCESTTKSVDIISELLPVVSDTICSPGITQLSVAGEQEYAWYDAPTLGNKLAEGKNYTQLIDSSTTFYVQELGGFSAQVGKLTKGSGESWSMGNSFDDEDKINKITVHQSLTIESVAVYVLSAGTSVTINIRNAGTIIHSATAKNLAVGKQTIELQAFLTPGSYTIDADGTDGDINFEASQANFPYKIDDYIEFTYNISWQSTWYGFFYDWKIFVGSACARTPVAAIINPLHGACNSQQTQTIELAAGWNLVSINVCPTDSSIHTIFDNTDVQEIKNDDGFWIKNHATELQSLHYMQPAKGYLIYANSAHSIEITGALCDRWFTNHITGWQLIGTPAQNSGVQHSIPFNENFTPNNTHIIKNFDGFWEPQGTLNSIYQFEPGKGYFIKSK